MKGLRILSVLLVAAGAAFAFAFRPEFLSGGIRPVNDLPSGAAYDAVRVSHLKQFEVGLELYFSEHGKYPETPGGSLIEMLPEGAPCSVLLPGGYIDECFSDPNGRARYFYRSDGFTFALEARLESERFPLCESGDDVCVHRVTDAEGDDEGL